jgi:hypothetical protein
LAAPDVRGPDDQSRWAVGGRTDLEESLGDAEPYQNDKSKAD